MQLEVDEEPGNSSAIIDEDCSGGIPGKFPVMGSCGGSKCSISSSMFGSM